jgi:hypothetical protein
MALEYLKVSIFYLKTSNKAGVGAIFDGVFMLLLPFIDFLIENLEQR